MRRRLLPLALIPIVAAGLLVHLATTRPSPRLAAIAPPPSPSTIAPSQSPTATAPSPTPTTAAPSPTAPAAVPPPRPAPATAGPPQGQGLLFDDEFNGSALDASAWVAMNRPGDASNSEIGCYQPRNATETGGSLVIHSQADTSCAGYAYTSAMVQWRSFAFTYGTIEFRARMAGGKGTWPALWLLGANCQQTNVTTPDNVAPCDWPNQGSDEVDVTEIKYGALTTVSQNLITSAGGIQGCSPAAADVSQYWHTYDLIWAPGSLTWQIDGSTTCSFTENVPSKPMFLIVNTAIGGNGGGTVDPATLPQSMAVDYVRVYRSSASR